MPPPNAKDRQQLIAQTAEEVLNDESYHLYAHLIAAITAFQLGKGPAPTDDEFAMWKAVQSKRLKTTVAPIDTFNPRPDRRLGSE
jgi:pyruvate/oxaloacetate carboxyltransferase